MKFSKRLDNITEYYFSKKLEEVRKLESEGKNIINLGIGSPDLPPSKSTINALITSAENFKNHSYQPYRSIRDLRKAMSEWYLKIYSVKSDCDKEILPLLGSKEGIFYLSMALLDEGDEVLVPNPGYPAYTSATRLAGGNIKYYDLKEENNWLPELEELSKTDLTKVKLMWINYPQMPTGAKADRKIFTEIAEFGKKHNIIICNDNPYSLVLNEEQLSILSFDESRETCIELNSFSKSFNMAGWRVGMLIANENIINAVLQVKSNVDSGMFRPVQDAAIIALSNPEEWHSERNKTYRIRRELVFKMLDTMNLTYDKHQAGLFVWAKLPDTIADAEKYLDNILFNAGVFITPGKIFGSNGIRYIRVSLCANERDIIEASNRITNMKNI